MKKLVFIIFLLIGLLVAMAMTMPNKTAHQMAVRKVLMKAVSSEIDKAPIDETLKSAGNIMASYALDEYVDKGLLVYEHTFISFSIILYPEGFFLSSIGAFGHVFLTFDEEDVTELTKQIDLMKLIK